jgi:TetR/AcrR family transcriptional repressor of nem operon
MGRVSDARDRLLQATAEILKAESYDAATVDAICARAGVRKGSFYYFFPSRTDLVVAALEEDWQRSRAHFDRAFSPLLPPVERLHRFFRLVHESQVDGMKRLKCIVGCVYTRVALSVGPEETPVREKVREVTESILRYLESAIRDGQERGKIRRGNPAGLARLVYEHVIGVLGVARVLNDLDSVAGMEARALALLGIKGAPSRRSAANV